MSIVNFSLDRYRFEHIEANSLDVDIGPEENQVVEMRFEVGVHDDDKESKEFAVTFQMDLAARIQDERKELVKTKARGIFTFSEGVEPHEIKEPLERLYATTLLYGALRPALDAIIANIGFQGLTMPLNLPISEEGRLPEAD
ncbi:hypothetical protein [Vreelandella sp. H-I2]